MVNLHLSTVLDERRDWRQFHMGVFRTAHHHRVIFYAQFSTRSPQRVSSSSLSSPGVLTVGQEEGKPQDEKDHETIY